MSATLHYFAEYEAQAQALAEALDVRAAAVSVHAFPDGESLVRVTPASGTALLVRSLDNPNTKLLEVVLAGAALHANGADRVVLVAPYLGYMRQDKAFNPGEAISQGVIGRIIDEFFDALVTVDPHLHRTPELQSVVPKIMAVTVSAADTIAAAIRPTVSRDTLLVGPDAESLPWVAQVAAPLGLEFIVGEKVRRADRKVTIAFPQAPCARGRPVMLVDDLISSGGTLIACADLLRRAGAISIAAVASHCLAGAADLAALRSAGIDPVLATDTVPGPSASISMAFPLAEALHSNGLA